MTDIIAKMQAALDEKKKLLRKRRASMRLHAEKLRALFADMEPLGCEPYCDGDWIYVSLTGDKHRFLAFARAMRKHGFEVPKVEKGATGFNKLNYLGEGDDALVLYFIFSSSVCRRVKVGTKMVEQDVFEVVCDELMPYGDQHAAAAPQPANDLPF